MELSVTDIYNHALSLIGSRSDVSSPTESSREAELCNNWFPRVRNQVFSAAHWSCGKRSKKLALLKERDFSLAWENDDPMPPWRFAYQLPADNLHVRYLDGYYPFELGRHGTSLALFTDVETPILNYTAAETDLTLWDEMITVAVYTGLAGVVCTPLTGARKKALSIIEEANNQILSARIMNANQDFVHFEHMPDWLIARGVSGPSYPNRYIYPVGPLFVMPTNV